MNKIREFIAYCSCFLCSAFIGNGYSPVFSVMAETRRRKSDLTGTLSFFSAKLGNDIATGVLVFTLPHYIVYLIAYLASKWGSVAASLTFYLVSNSVCFFQMLGTFYPPTVEGYLSCMVAGLPFLVRNLIGCLSMDIVFGLMRHLETSQREKIWIPQRNVLTFAT